MLAGVKSHLIYIYICTAVGLVLAIPSRLYLPMRTRILRVVPGTGLEPVRPQWPRDFKSLVSTDSTIWAALLSAKVMI